ncbi:MAG: YggU family protein [Acidobacteria bacterium]|nr:YggU family protein [Acidobacteriota bacterium]MBK9529316.1 YggU family protein [Acidobacteriota bacterium]
MKIIETTNAVTFSVRVIPRASRSEIVGEHDGALKVKLASPPVDGAANAELIKLLAKKFGVSKNDIEIVSGETSKNKRIKINNLSKSKFVEVTT